MKIVPLLLVAGLAALACVGPGMAQHPTPQKLVWLGAWGYPPSPPPPGRPDPIVPPPPPLLNGKPYAGMPTELLDSPVPAVPSFQTPDLSNVTVRELVRLSAGGKRVRIRLSNEAGDTPLVMGSVHVGEAAANGAIAAGDYHAVTFGGRSSVTVPSGAPLLSDPIDMPARALETLIVSVYLPGSAPRLGHSAWQFVSPGPDLGAAPAQPEKLIRLPVFATRVDVDTSEAGGTIVALGDSITEGALSTSNAFRSWPDRLAERLVAERRPWTVVNAGIGGNRLLHNVTGPSALSRLDRDALSVPGVRAIILLEGINDIQRTVDAGATPLNATAAAESVTADDIIFADKQIIARAHARGVRVIGATLTPFEGAGTYTPAKEAIREAVNQWIRTANEFDGVIDFEAVVRDPANPKAFREGLTGFDHLHPTDVGYAAMAGAVNLDLFGGP